MLTPMVDRAVQEGEVHLQLVDVVRRRCVTAATSFAAHTILFTDVSAIPEHGGILNVDAGAGLRLENLPALLRLLASLFPTQVFLVQQRGQSIGHTLEWELKMASYTSTM